MDDAPLTPDLDNTLEGSISAPLAILQHQLKEKHQAEIKLHPELANIKGRPDFENLIEVCELKKDILLRGAMLIFCKEFKNFIKNGLAIMLLFLLAIFCIKSSESAFRGRQNYAYFITSWIFLCYLRASFLAIICNYFSFSRPIKPLLYGL